MVTNDNDWLMRTERNADLARELENERLVQAVNQAHTGGRGPHRKAAIVIGDLMMNLGERLQGYDRPASVQRAKTTVYPD
ncbi:MAG: hypothetical protein HY326_07820 [Chloroflexi bacterium]|nr:hypothetical protein [Chloroflexota bacterium]